MSAESQIIEISGSIFNTSLDIITAKVQGRSKAELNRLYAQRDVKTVELLKRRRGCPELVPMLMARGSRDEEITLVAQNCFYLYCPIDETPKYHLVTATLDDIARISGIYDCRWVFDLLICDQPENYYLQETPEEYLKRTKEELVHLGYLSRWVSHGNEHAIPRIEIRRTADKLTTRLRVLQNLTQPQTLSE